MINNVDDVLINSILKIFYHWHK